MNVFLKILKFIMNSIMTIIIVIGIIFIVMYVAGIEPYVVESGSMSPSIETGSLSFINKRAGYDTVKENDIIAFTAPTGVKVTHRAVVVSKSGITTKGDANIKADSNPVTKNNYIGKNIFSIPKVGYAVKLLQSTTGKIICGTIIIILFIAGFLIGDKPKKKDKHEE